MAKEGFSTEGEVNILGDALFDHCRFVIVVNNSLPEATAEQVRSTMSSKRHMHWPVVQ
jgi:hypothetical protein